MVTVAYYQQKTSLRVVCCILAPDQKYIQIRDTSGFTRNLLLCFPDLMCTLMLHTGNQTRFSEPKSLDGFLQQPTLLRFASRLGLETETAVEFVCLIGVIVAFLAVLFNSQRDAPTFAVLWGCYFSLFQVRSFTLFCQSQL